MSDDTPRGANPQINAVVRVVWFCWRGAARVEQRQELSARAWSTASAARAATDAGYRVQRATWNPERAEYRVLVTAPDDSGPYPAASR